MNDVATLDPVLQRIRLDALQDWFETQAVLPGFGEWEQATFRDVRADCGTRYCLAGKACDWTGKWVNETTGIWLIAQPGDTDTELRDIPDSEGGGTVECVPAWNRAMVVLGLTDSEAHILFAGRNDAGQVREAFAAIRSGQLRLRCPSCAGLQRDPQMGCNHGFHALEG